MKKYSLIQLLMLIWLLGATQASFAAGEAHTLELTIINKTGVNLYFDNADTYNIDVSNNAFPIANGSKGTVTLTTTHRFFDTDITFFAVNPNNLDRWAIVDVLVTDSESEDQNVMTDYSLDGGLGQLGSTYTSQVWDNKADDKITLTLTNNNQAMIASSPAMSDATLVNNTDHDIMTVALYLNGTSEIINQPIKAHSEGHVKLHVNDNHEFLGIFSLVAIDDQDYDKWSAAHVLVAVPDNFVYGSHNIEFVDSEDQGLGSMKLDISEPMWNGQANTKTTITINND